VSASEPGPASTPIDELFASVAPALIAWAALRIPPELRATVSAEDVAQEVWLRAIRIHATSFDASRTSPRGWLFAVAKNVLLETMRAANHPRERGIDGRTSRWRALGEVPASITSITSRASRDEAVLDFVARIEQLDEADRMLAVHCGLEDMPIREAAQRLGIGHEAAGKRWQRLRQRMAEWPASRRLIG
jgi:RNA polymerase sigma factor (sigma-70 family)